MNRETKYLSESEKSALLEIKRRVSAIFPVRSYILFGSKARGDYLPDADVDLLIVTERELTHGERHCVSHEITHVNLEFNTLYSFLAISAERWDSELYRYVPIHKNVEREGVLV
jgi:predicted nucleotidyltransferase